VSGSGKPGLQKHSYVAFSKEKAHERAERYAAKGQHDKAAREYQQIVDHDAKDIRAWLMLADCLVRCGDAPRAIARYMQVAQYYVEQRQPQKALAVYRQVLNLDQARIDVQLKVAALNMQLGRTPDAIALYERIGQVQLQAGQIGKALEIFKLVADADPTAVSRRLRLAELYSREKRTQDAVDAFRAAGDQLLASERKADYVRVAERLLYHDANDKGTIRQLARVYLELGDPRRALMKLNALLHADPSDRLGIELLAETFLALGKLDKALSVIGELARELRQHDPMREDAIRVLRRGLSWSPGHPEFTAALDELLEGETAASGTPAIEVLSREIEAGAPQEIRDAEEIGDSDVLELDADDVEMEEEAEPGAPAKVGSAGSFTASVMSEARHEPTDPDNLTDFDKILFEARVYIKYRLFDHALDHVDAALEQEPDHIGALSLRARAYTELGRLQEAADTHLQVARRVSAADPKLAREHLAAALTAAPQHPEAQRLSRTLGDAAPAAPRSTEDDGDSGMFDVAVGGEGDEGLASSVYDPDEDELTPVSGVEVGEADSSDDFRIDVQDEEPAAASSARMPVENRFGISHSGPLPEADEPGSRAGTPLSALRARPPSDVSASSPSRTPPAGFVARPPSELQRSPASRTPPTGFVARPPGIPSPIPTPGEHASAADSGAHEAAEDVVAALERGVQQAEIHGLVPHDPLVESSPLAVDDGIEVEFDDEDLEPVDIPRERAPEPAAGVPARAAAAAKPAASWPDLSDDLAEIRFFVDQGLDDDAEAALAELRRRHPGHPELEPKQAPTAEVASSTLSEEAAKPLVDVDEETADEDDYLAAIFGEQQEAPAKASAEPELRARLEDEAQDVDPQTAYDLGLAYREMGLVDDAIAQFQIAAKDDGFRSRALVMTGTLRVHRGETDRAVDDLREAVRLASTPDESSEANYELGLLYQKIGNTAAAVSQLQAVAKGFRDRDERLTQLEG
jgi:pilus assembly protein FimV